MINTQNDKNFIISSEGDLIITQARLSDTGNYTCGAVNIAGSKLSTTVPFVVYGKLLNICPVVKEECFLFKSDIARMWNPFYKAWCPGLLK